MQYKPFPLRQRYTKRKNKKPRYITRSSLLTNGTQRDSNNTVHTSNASLYHQLHKKEGQYDTVQHFSSINNGTQRARTKRHGTLHILPCRTTVHSERVGPRILPVHNDNDTGFCSNSKEGRLGAASEGVTDRLPSSYYWLSSAPESPPQCCFPSTKLPTRVLSQYCGKASGKNHCKETGVILGREADNTKTARI